jgi:hypothetical protein
MSESRHRDRASYFDPPYGLKKSPPIGLLSVVFSILGLSISTCGGALGAEAGHPTIPKMDINCSVLAAAPTKVRSNVPSILDAARLKYPPPYMRVESRNVAWRMFMPSSWTIWRSYMSFSKRARGGGGTFGVYALSSIVGPAGGAAGALLWAKATECRTVEVWGLKEPSSAVQSTPSTNDPNATITFRITPPSSGSAGNCSAWKYHKGKAPKPKRIIRPKKVAGRILISLAGTHTHQLCLVV